MYHHGFRESYFYDMTSDTLMCIMYVKSDPVTVIIISGILCCSFVLLLTRAFSGTNENCVRPLSLSTHINKQQVMNTHWNIIMTESETQIYMRTFNIIHIRWSSSSSMFHVNVSFVRQKSIYLLDWLRGVCRGLLMCTQRRGSFNQTKRFDRHCVASFGEVYCQLLPPSPPSTTGVNPRGWGVIHLAMHKTCSFEVGSGL